MSRDFVYEKLIRPSLFSIDPESVHYWAASAMLASRSLLPLLGLKYGRDDLKTSLFGTPLDNPIGLAAGFDKNAKLVGLLAQLGFGFAEIGSVCARPHGGNPRPRLFRLPMDKALINRLGLNGLGAEVVANNLARFGSQHLPVGINIAKTNDPRLVGTEAVDDMVYSFDRLKDLQAKYFTINTSCPNTHEGCLKESEQLAQVLTRISALNTRNVPILLKLSPDSSADFIEELVSLSIAHEVAGFVCGNTSLRRDILVTPAQTIEAIGAGGLSGKPLMPLNLELTRRVARLKKAEQVIIGVGGIESGADAFEYLSAGARVVQIYTGFVYRGPSAVKGICTELAQILGANKLSLTQLSKGHAAVNSEHN